MKIRAKSTLALQGLCLVASLGLWSGSVQAQDLSPAAARKHDMVGSVLFDTATSQLDPATQRVLEALGALLRDQPDLQVELSGFADARGPGELNLVLSQQRAAAVAQVLEAAGVEPARIHLDANGEWFAQRAATSNGALALQRRVEIRLKAAL